MTIIFSCLLSSKEKGTGGNTNFPAQIKSLWCLRVLGPNPMYFSAVNNLSLSRYSSSTADRGREALSRLDKQQQRRRRQVWVSWSLDELIRENSRWKAERRTKKKKRREKEATHRMCWTETPRWQTDATVEGNESHVTLDKSIGKKTEMFTQNRGESRVRRLRVT